VRYEAGTMKRYDLGDVHRSPVFTRAFSFFEDKAHNLFAVSYKGNMFWYNRQKDEFILLDNVLPRDCSHALFSRGKLWLAAGEGLYRITLENLKVAKTERILAASHVSHVLEASDSTLWASSYDESLFAIRRKGDSTATERIPYVFNGINASYCSYEGDVWSCTDKGVVLLQKNLFVLADPQSQSHFIEGIVSDPKTDETYYAHKPELLELSRDKYGVHSALVYADDQGYFQALQIGPKGLWASNSTRVFLFQNNKLAWQHDFASEGNFVHDIYLDKQQNLWLSQAGNKYVVMISDSLTFTNYPVQAGLRGEINLIRQGPAGMYAGASGTDTYLLLKGNGDNAFRNISAPVDFSVQSDFNVYDLDMQGEVVWLASTEGLLRYEKGHVERIDLGEAYTGLSVSSVEMLDHENVLFANAHGLLRYNTRSREFWLYDENSGLPSNTITGRGIYIDHLRRLWIGTSFGIALATAPITQSSPTVKPFCVEARVNGNLVRFNQGVFAPYGAFLNLQFSSITFPEHKVILQWMMDDQDKTWHAMTNHQLNVGDLSPGTHTLRVRAKKNTGLDWSEPAVFKIHIGDPFWQRAEFLLFVFTIALVIAWLSNSITSRVLNRRKAALQRLIDERTGELQKANEELMVRNNELDRFVYSASHDLSAPLKSILGLIVVSRLESPAPQQQQYLTMMEGSVRKLEDFIRDVVSYSRNSRLEVKLETFDFVTFVHEVLDDHQYAPNFGAIKFEIHDALRYPVTADTMRLKIVLNNLISNAIKFHRFNGTETPFIHVAIGHREHAYVITVRDNGMGIDEQHINRIFEMFYRASEQAQGSGLGLYILKETVTKMKGRVTVKSTYGAGTVFTVMLPK
jgi:signal transduction histidine kinase